MQSAETLAPELERRLSALFRESLRAAPRELSRTATSVLATLRDQGACRVTELAASEAVAQPSMTTLVGRLEKSGYVERAADPDDRRAVRVSITREGRDVLKRSSEARHGVLGSHLADLAAGDRALIAAALPALDRLIDSFRETSS
jgi:DNA-binding MarR family transcriptional regulator